MDGRGVEAVLSGTSVPFPRQQMNPSTITRGIAAPGGGAP